MLTLKFSVPFVWRISNVRTLAKTSFTGEKTSFIPKNSFENKRSRCLDYKRALEKCPKPSLVKRCSKPIFPDNIPQSKCSWSNADDYRRAYQAIKVRSEKLIELIETTTNAIVQEIQNEISKIRCDENVFTKKILDRVEPTILELSNLDPVCAMKKKLDVLVLNDRTQRELTNLHCSSQLEIQTFECELEKLTCELKSRVDHALNLVSSCRASTSPQELINCVENKSREAAKILDDVKVDFESRIKNVKIAKDETIREDKKMIKDVTKMYEENMTKLITGMINCIRNRKTN